MEYSINTAEMIEQYEANATAIKNRIRGLQEEKKRYHWNSKEYGRIYRRIEILEGDLENIYTGLCLLRKR